MYTGWLHWCLTELVDAYKLCINRATPFKSSVSVFKHYYGIFQHFLVYFYNKRWEDLSNSESNVTEDKMSLNNEALTDLRLLLMYFDTLEILPYRLIFLTDETKNFNVISEYKMRFKIFSKIVHQKAWYQD